MYFFHYYQVIYINLLLTKLTDVTGRYDRVVSTLDSYSGDPGSNFGSETGYPN
jgi:hypothetical protein